MIKYNSNTINNWYYGDDNIVKVYRNGAVCYYKIISSGGTTAQTPCYAVVNDISQYEDTEFEDVFNDGDGKWYKLNNLNQYEEYGVYGDSIASGGTSRLPQGYTEVEYVENTGSSSVNLVIQLMKNANDSFEVVFDNVMTYTSGGENFQTFITCTREISPYEGWYERFDNNGNVVIAGYLGTATLSSGRTIVSGDVYHTSIGLNSTPSNITHDYPLNLFSSLDSTKTPWRFCKGKLYNMQVTYNNTLVRDLVPCKNSSNVAGLYDLVNDVFYTSESGYDQLVAGSAVTPTAATYYQGKLAIVDGYEYIYSGASWVNVGEVSGSTATLPNVDFMLNYNARDYVSSTYTIPKTSGQIKDVDAVCNYGYNIVDHHEDGYITVTGDTRMILSGSTYLGRNNNQTGCTMTIVSKAKTTTNYSIITNRGNSSSSQMNWMWRYPSNGIFLHGGSSYNSVKYYTNTTVNPIIASIRTSYNNGVVQQLNDWTNNGSYNGSFAFGTEYNGNSSLFCDYASNNGEFWYGDFYWVYMSKDVLTDEQIQQVIAYNEGGGGTEIYPLYYDEKLDPPNNLSFSSMTEAEEYECPWVGMQATIDGVIYVFSGDSTSGYEWVEKPTPPTPTGYTDEYLTFVATESGTFKFSGNSINYSIDDGTTWAELASNTNSPTVTAGSKILWKATLTPNSNIGIGTFSSTANFVAEGNPLSLLYGDNFIGVTDLSGKDYAFKYLFKGCSGLTSAENLIVAVTTLSNYCCHDMFNNCTSLIVAPQLPATTISQRCYWGMFYGCSSMTTAPELPATTLQEGSYCEMFNSCTSLTTAPTLPAATLTQYAYYRMFYNCRSINRVTCLATNINVSNCTTQWLYGVSANGTFTKNPNMSSWSTGNNGIPNGWTVEDYQG